jgi:1-acyl-sn-glycerol-3-phosphate acyltransferase
LQKTNSFIIGYRIVRILILLLLGILIIAVSWSFTEEKTRTKLTKWWCQKLLRCFNLTTVLFGAPPQDQASNNMFLANHVSWADIYALNSILPLQFIAKSDINHWPILGYLVRKSGTIFINRSNRKDTSRIVEMTTKCLLAGGNVGFFPEGTTTDGTSLAHFKSSIVQAAINANAQLRPVAIRYPLPNGGINTKMAYAGEMTLGKSMMHVLKQKNPTVELHFLTPIDTQSANRQALTQSAFESIASALKF